MRSAPATMPGKPTMPGKSGMTAKAAPIAAAMPGKPGMTAIPAVTGKPAPVGSTIGNSAIPKSTVHIPAIDDTTSPISGPGPAAAIVSLAEPAIVKTTAVKISGIPSFKKWPIVGIVIVIPVVTVPGRIVIINITGEFVFIPYRAGSVGISIWILVNGRRRRIYRPHRDGKSNMRIHVYLRVALDGHQAGPDDSRKCK
jgi:hypothetical protein